MVTKLTSIDQTQLEKQLDRELEQQLSSLEKLDESVLEIPVFQRRVRNWKVENWMPKFNPNALGVLDVWYDRGHYWVLDGQHRLQLCRAVGYTEPLDCKVFWSLTLADAERIFDIRNTQVAATSLKDVWQPRIDSGDIEFVEIKQAVESVGFVVDPNRNHPQYGTLDCVSNLASIRRLGGVPLLMYTLRFIQDVPEWHQGEHLAGWHSRGNAVMQGTFIEGVARFFHKYGPISETNRKDFAYKLRSKTPKGIAGLANERYHHNNPPAIGETLRDLYNAGRQPRNRVGVKLPQEGSEA